MKSVFRDRKEEGKQEKGENKKRGKQESLARKDRGTKARGASKIKRRRREMLGIEERKQE